MKHILLIVIFFFAFFSTAQVESKKERKNSAPAMNNNVLEEAEEMDTRSLKKSKSDQLQQQKVAKIQQVTNNLAATIQAANRMSTQRSYTAEQKEKLQNGVAEIAAIDQNSFEYHLYNYLREPHNFKEIESLRKAEQLNAYDFSVLTSFTAYHKIKGNSTELKAYLSKLYQGKYFNDNLLDYAELTLQSLPKNSTLVTHGKNDTYPLLIQQYIKNTRKDVEIISLDHLLSEEYRKELANKGYTMPNKTIIDTKYLEAFVRSNKDKMIVCANSIPQPYLRKISSQTTVIGYGFAAVDPTKAKKNNIDFYQMYLRKSLPDLIMNADRLTLGNSLPLLFDLRNSFIDSGQFGKVKEVEGWILKIGAATGKSKQINAILQ